MAAAAASFGTFGDEIGKGTYGKILATSTGHVVKIMRRHNYGFRSYELNNMVYLSHLDHPHIVKCRGVDFDKRSIMIFMDRYDGDLIKLCLGNIGIFTSMPMFKSLCSQMISAVAYLTSQGIIHRDIKPNNILFRRDSMEKESYTYVLADFDLVQGFNYGPCVSEDKLFYTEPYRPPELLMMHTDLAYSFSADVWALGVTLATVFLTKHVFIIKPYASIKKIISQISTFVEPGTGPVSTEWKAITKPAIYPKSFTTHVGVEKFFRKMIQIEPSDRASIFELQRDEFLLEIVPPETSPPPPVPERVSAFSDESILWTKLVEWIIVTGMGYHFSLASIIMTIELLNRYCQISLDETKLAACAAMNIAINFNVVDNDMINVFKIHNASMNEFSPERIVSKSQELMSLLNFDLTSPTPYHQIQAIFAGSSSKISQAAIKLAMLAALWPELYFAPAVAKIVVYITMDCHNSDLARPDIAPEMVSDWYRQFRDRLMTYDGSVGKYFGDIMDFPHTQSKI